MTHPVELKPLPDQPDERYENSICVNIGGRRIQIKVGIEAREVCNGPAEVIEMPLSSGSEKPA